MHGAQSFLQPPAAFCQWNADCLELGGVLTADADTHPEPARSEARQRPELLRQHNGVPQRQQHDARAQRDPLGRCRDHRQRDDRFEQRPGVEEVVPDVDAVEPCGLGAPGRLDDPSGVDVAVVGVGGGGEHQADDWRRGPGAEGHAEEARSGRRLHHHRYRPNW